MTSFTDRATRYAQAVVAGSVDACEWVKLACQRQLDDLARQDDPQWPYRFDPVLADRVCIFVELMPHVKGPLANKHELIRLEDWQCFVLTTVFGWVHKSQPCPMAECQHEPGMRRFREVYVEVPRGNAKTTLLAAVALYLLACDGEQGAEVYSAATKRDQAKIVWDIAKQMVKRTKPLQARYGVKAWRMAISQVATDSKFVPLSADHDTQDGLNTSAAVIDELHAHKTAGIYNVIKTSMQKRLQALLFSITTAGSNRVGVCYTQRTFITRILQGIVKRDNPGAMQVFGIIYTLDEGDDPWCEASLIKANPNWFVSIDRLAIIGEMEKAKVTAAEQNNFLTKHLNIWVNAAVSFMDMVALLKCADPTLRIEDFIGQRCWDGLDLASKIDLASKATLFPREDHCEGGPCLTVFCRNYVPRKQVLQGANADIYATWEREGWLIVSEASTTDFDTIEEDVFEDHRTFDLVELALDPHNATQLGTHLVKQGITVVEVNQNVVNLSEPMKLLQEYAYNGRLHYDGDPVFEWAVSNIIVKPDIHDNIYPLKEVAANKIDPVVATLVAIRRWLNTSAEDDAGESKYEREGLARV